MALPLDSIKIDERRRWSRASEEVHTGQLHAITGIPREVSVPKNGNFTALNLFVLGCAPSASVFRPTADPEYPIP